MIDNTPALQPLLNRIPPEWPRTLEIHKGWVPLLIALNEQLTDIAPHYQLHQCKTKFGALAFYAQPTDDPYTHLDDFSDAIRAAEWRSTEICELCGQPARHYVIRLWTWTLCPTHATGLDQGDH